VVVAAVAAFVPSSPVVSRVDGSVKRDRTGDQ